MTLEIEIDNRVAAWLEDEAARRGLSLRQVAAGVLTEAAIPSITEAEVLAMHAQLPRGTRQEVRELAIQQGASLALTPEDLRGGGWPEDESVDEFLAEIRAMRRGWILAGISPLE